MKMRKYRDERNSVICQHQNEHMHFIKKKKTPGLKSAFKIILTEYT